jgi:septum formation topological specificity factor MinE
MNTFKLQENKLTQTSSIRFLSKYSTLYNIIEKEIPEMGKALVNSKLIYDYSSQPNEWMNAFTYYSEWIQKYADTFHLDTGLLELSINENNYTMEINAIIVVLDMFHNSYKQKQRNNWEYTIKESINELRLLTWSIQEEFTIPDDLLVNIRELYKNLNTHKKIDDITSIIRKWNKIDNTPDYKITHRKNTIIHQVLFHLIFLQEWITIFRPYDTVLYDQETIQSPCIVDLYVLQEIIKWWYSGEIINCNIPIGTFQQNINATKERKNLSAIVIKHIAQQDEKNYNQEIKLNEIIKITKQYIEKYPRSEFRILTKNQQIHVLEVNVESNNPKHRNNISKEMWTKAYIQKDRSRTYKKKINL